MEHAGAHAHLAITSTHQAVDACNVYLRVWCALQELPAQVANPLLFLVMACVSLTVRTDITALV